MMRLTRMVMETSTRGHAAAAALALRWAIDEGSLQFWRASSNFVYRMKLAGETVFLRFNHEEERSLQQVEAELDFMEYLSIQGSPVVTPIPSLQGSKIETLDTPRGKFHAVAFTAACGHALELPGLSASGFSQWGAALAQLHQLSRAYIPSTGPRQAWSDALDFVRSVLLRHPEETDAAAELARLRAWMESLPADSSSFGLIHYDFELDNLLWNEEEQRFHLIDFDDAMYHWYAADIVCALGDLDELEADAALEARNHFLTGYAAGSGGAWQPEWLQWMPGFERFSALYGFARVLGSLEGCDPRESSSPPWLAPLARKLQAILEQDRSLFRSP